ncbi:ribonuclease Y [Patescibacteria group bacterium]|nr:ribonuclease Y [Patescibacteria group bacterium]
MNQVTLLFVGFVCLALGAILGYYTRQSIAKRRRGTIEAKLQKKILQTKQESEEILTRARQGAAKIISEAQKEIGERRNELLKTERLLFRREHILDQKISSFETREKEFAQNLKKLKEMKEKLTGAKEEIQKNLERTSHLSQKEAREELMKNIEREYEREFQERMQKLSREGEEKFKQKAQEMIVGAIQKYALSQAQEITTTTLNLPSDEIKGRIIGKEGRNIKAFEKLTGVEVLVDDTPETVIISGFNPIRRHIAKIALERLVQDGRIQPARIEEQVKRAREEVESQIKEFGKNAVYETGIVDLPSKIVSLLGRLYFRLSYGQNVLLHSIEVAHLASALADELGANRKVTKKAGLLHDIGKAIDREIEGSHVDIGIKILEKFRIDQEVIEAMKAHHEEYEPQTIEAVLVKVADQISGARPGARKDTLENYLRRLKELEDIALDFAGVEKAYAIQAGREIRVFVRPEEIGDLEAYKLARDIAGKIQEELNYPGEIKVNVIRETRVVEYAR